MNLKKPLGESVFLFLSCQSTARSLLKQLPEIETSRGMVCGIPFGDYLRVRARKQINKPNGEGLGISGLLAAVHLPSGGVEGAVPGPTTLLILGNLLPFHGAPVAMCGSKHLKD